MNTANLKIQSTPYTYILEWTKQGKRYIGARWAAGCHPEDLWSSYFTSSKYVAEFVKEFGEPDIILIDKIFTTPMDAMTREQELQKQFDVRHNDTFLNKAIAGVYDHADPEIRKRMSDSHRWKKHSPEWITWVTEFHRNRPRSAETNKRISEALTGKKWSEDQHKNFSATRRGVPSGRKGIPISEAHKAKNRIAMLGKKHSQETKRLMSADRAGKKFPIVECPHCGKTGGAPAMGQWHFNNCKSKKE